ncbi:hypothetical protein WR25_14468 isoform A [Diploscapter pachys]|uniref:USP domain-containing protein n=1 Tax=Diploscapter pachys TaxID=2018661 RepID=A0A2A2LD04_9BILA|nr:hypothetical protein WR25_14468 isoform A [Diploscapter pachys]
MDQANVLDQNEWVPPSIGPYSFLSHFPINPISPDIYGSVTTLTFDPFVELLWCGTQNGHIFSFLPTTAERYTCFAGAIPDMRNPMGAEIRALLPTENVVLSLTPTMLKANLRQGTNAFTFCSPHATSLSCMQRLENTNLVVLGGEQQKLLEFDVEKRKEIRMTLLKQKDAMALRSNVSNLFSADSEGNITMRSSATLEAIKTISAHGGPITDFDVHGNKIITCGCSMRQNSIHGDPYVKVYDIRTFKALPPVPFTFAPLFTRFMPTFCDSRIVIVSQLGQVQITDLNDGKVGVPTLLEAGGLNINAFAFSSNKKLLAFGTELGSLSMYAEGDNPMVNEASWPIEFADPPTPPPQSFPIDDTTTPLASIPLPFPTSDTLLSDWPPEMCVNIYRRLKPMGKHANVKTRQFVCYAPNPRMGTPYQYFNVVPYFLDYEEARESAITPVEENETLTVPPFYRKLNIRKSKHLTTNCISDLLKLNKSRHVVLENITPSSAVVNPIARIFYHICPIRNEILCHLCEDEYCITCQMNFLFRMLSDMPKSAATSSRNLMRSLAISKCPNLEEPSPRTSFAIFDHILAKLFEDIKDEESLNKIKNLLNIGQTVNSRCIRCGTVEARDETRFIVKLNYPPAAEHFTLCTLIEKALHLRDQKEDECNECKTKTRKEEIRKVNKLPEVLIVDTNASSPNFLQFWKDQLGMSERSSNMKSAPSGEESCLDSIGKPERPCRYGNDCRNRPHCKYSHGISDWEAECAHWLRDTGGNWRHFIPANFLAKVSNGMSILYCNSEEAKNDADFVQFDLIGILVTCGSGTSPDESWTNSVIILRDSQSDDEKSPWTLINEILVTRVHTDEALRMDYRCKLPLGLIYSKKSSNILQVEEKRINIPASVFLTDSNLTGNDDVAKDRRLLALPEKTDLVGIDAEFISICTDKKKSVGRVSCVDSSGNKVLIDDYIVTCDGDIVDDYLTRYRSTNFFI